MHSPVFCYLQQHHWAVGSAYKYFTLLQNRYGGVLLRSKRPVAVIQDWKADIIRLEPALIFCRGDWLKYYQLATMYGIPYILIEQDVHSLRTRLSIRQLQIEKEMVEEAAGIIFTSEDHLAYLRDDMGYKMPNVGVVHLRPLRQMLAWHPKPKLPGNKNLVYAGGLVRNGGGNYGYRNYRSIFQDFVKAGWNVHIYGSKNQYATVRELSRTEGIFPHGWIPYEDLLQEMSQYTAGLQAYAKEQVNERQFNYTKYCRPNKTWDYLAAGIPTIGLHAGNCAKIYVEGGWGIEIPDTKRETIENLKLPSFPPELRYEQVMENDLPIIEKVIATALKAEKAKKITTVITKAEKLKQQKEEDDMKSDKLWHRLTKPVIENGRLLYGRGRRIPMTEAIRLGLVKKEVVVKEEIKRKRARKAKKAPAKKATPKKKVEKVETKPLLDEEKKGEVKKTFDFGEGVEFRVDDKPVKPLDSLDIVLRKVKEQKEEDAE